MDDGSHVLELEALTVWHPHWENTPALKKISGGGKKNKKKNMVYLLIYSE
jgi:hypothetical protein